MLRFLLSACLLALLMRTEDAHAQTLTLSETTGVRVEREEERFTYEDPLVISRQDCFDSSPNRFANVDSDADLGGFTWLTFIPTVTGADNQDNVEVWISEGADCTVADNRTGTAQCALVYKTDKAETRNPRLVVNPRDIVERAKPGTEGFTDTDPAGVEDTCVADRNQEEANLVFWIMLRSGDEIPSHVKWETSIDLVAPDPPEEVDVGAGDAHIFIEWDIDSTSENPDTEGFTFYCVPSGTMAGMGGAASMPPPAEGGAGGAGSASCDQSILVEGELPAEEAEAYVCGEATGRTTRRGQTEDVVNGTTYAVAISSLDAVGNKGVLSPVSCVTPKPVTTFYEGYQAAGGKGGGGFCALSTTNKPVLLWTLGLVLSAIVFRRRARA